MMYLYNITDASGNTILFRGLTSKAVSKAIGVKTDHVYTYADKEWVYKSQYRIINAGIAESYRTRFAKEWDKVTNDLKPYGGLLRRIKLSWRSVR